MLLGSSLMSLRQAALSSSEIASNIGKSVEITARITTDPREVEKKVSGRNFLPPSYSFLAKSRVPIRIITTDLSVANLLPGQEIRGVASIRASKEQRVAALVIMKKVEVVSAATRWAKLLSSIRHGLSVATGDGDTGALIPGMVLGDTSKQSTEFKSDMRRSGLTHLVAVSGANFAIVSGFALWCMQFLFRRMNYRIIATSISLIAFISLVRPSPSVLRAAAMAAVILFAKATAQGRDSLPALGFAIAAVVVADPWQARDPGFALSVLATAGLLLFAPKLTTSLERFIPKPLAQATAPPIAAMLFCSPIIVAISGFLSPMSIVANILAAPVVAAITIVGFMGALLSPILPGFAHLLVLVVKPFAAWIVLVAHWCASFPGFALSVVVVLLFTSIFFLPKRILTLFIICILTITWVQRFPAGDWDVANCDVGQGDAMVLYLGDHKGIVIDTGPDPALMDRCLQRLGIDEIPLLILTHNHADHVGGLSGAIKGRSVGTQWFENVKRGTSAKVGSVTLEVIWPDGGTYDPNNSSIAVIVRTPTYSLFAGGDLEPKVQSQLQVPRVDIYKVCHHGSVFQDESFTRALSPKVSIISVGDGNTYGHPAPQTITALDRLGSIVLRTDRDGAVAINTRNNRLAIQRSKSKWKLWRWE